MDEVVFFHRPFRSVILADLIENFTDPLLRKHWREWRRSFAKLAAITSDNPRAPLEWYLSHLDRAAARAARENTLGRDVERVIVAHVERQRSDGHAFPKRAFACLDWNAVRSDQLSSADNGSTYS